MGHGDCVSIMQYHVHLMHRAYLDGRSEEGNCLNATMITPLDLFCIVAEIRLENKGKGRRWWWKRRKELTQSGLVIFLLM